MTSECEKCGEHALGCRCPTEITREDIEDLFVKYMNGDFEIKMRQCLNCSKNFLPNYNDCECDECWFSRFPKVYKSLTESAYF